MREISIYSELLASGPSPKLKDKSMDFVTAVKTSRSKDENQQQTQPTYDAESGNRARATFVGGERSHHCAIPAPPIIVGNTR